MKTLEFLHRIEYNISYIRPEKRRAILILTHTTINHQAIHIMIKSTTVFIHTELFPGGTPAGRFDWDSNTLEGSYMYDRHYLKTLSAIPIDPISLPLSSKLFTTSLNNGFFGALRDSAPDYWGRLVLAKKLNCNFNQLTDFDAMIYPTGTRIGNLSFRDSPTDPYHDVSPPDILRLDDLLTASYAIENDQAVSPDIQSLLLQGSSLGGARPKVTVQDSYGKLWLVKLPSNRDKTENAGAEAAMLDIASECGLATPAFKVMTLATGRALMVERFDRFDTPIQQNNRIGFLSAMSILQKDESDRDFSYVELAKKMREIGTSDDYIRELFSRMVLNGMVRNIDDHGKNHGFLIHNGIHLSPVYDITPSMTPLGVGSDFYHSMECGQFGRLASLQNYLSNCQQFGLTTSDAVDIIVKIYKVVSQNSTFLQKHGVTDKIINQLQPSFCFGHLNENSFLSSLEHSYSNSQTTRPSFK